MGPYAQKNALLYNILAPHKLCGHLVHKGVRTSCCVTHGLWHAWIASPQNKGMSDVPTSQRIFFCLSKSCVNLPSTEWLQDNWHRRQDSLQYVMEPSGPPEGGLEGWPATSMWYSVSGLLAAWAPPTRTGPVLVVHPTW